MLPFTCRTTIDCSTKCLATKGCSAFHFDDSNQACELGSSLKLTQGNPSGPVMTISTLKIGELRLWGQAWQIVNIGDISGIELWNSPALG